MMSSDSLVFGDVAQFGEKDKANWATHPSRRPRRTTLFGFSMKHLSLALVRYP
jgi:hypothetical protein